MPAFPLRKLGASGPNVSAMGFGAMGMNAFYGNQVSEEENFKILDHVLAAGCNFIDTADIYGDKSMGDNERLIGDWMKERGNRKDVFLCTKFGNFRSPEVSWEIRGSKEYVHEAVQKSLKNLQVDTIDLYYQHRVDRSRPIEETMEALKELLNAGTIKHVGLSEATSDEIRRAAKVVKISALQIEFSPLTPEIMHNGILDTCRELGIAVVAYSPLGRGIMTGALTKAEDLDDGDFRKTNPRFQGENLTKNLKFVKLFQDFAKQKSCTAGQLCLAWVMAKGEDIIPIPGTKKKHYLEENLGAVNVKLSESEVAELDKLIKSAEIGGDRYASPSNQAF